MRITTLVTLGTLVLFAGCDKAKEPVAADVPSTAATQQAPAPSAPVASAPDRQPDTAPAPSQTAIEPDDRAVPQPPVYTDYRPSLAQPRPIAAPWAPPPLLGEAVPPQPYPDAAWTGGYWVWREQWVWAPGHWARPPRPDYRWVPPYYEHRDDRVLFVDGFWSAPGVAFVRPAATLSIALAVVGAGIAIGRPPIGPQGPFVPPPPGSHWGLIVPAPVGTSPFVVRGAPPIVAPGMRVTNNVSRVTNDVHNTTIENRNTTVINNVTIEAPASATSNHQAVHVMVAPQSHLVAGGPAVVPSTGATPVPPSPRDHGAPGREVDVRPPEPPHAAANATRPAAAVEAKPASHVDVPAPVPRQAGRPPEAARPNDREATHDAQRPPAHASASAAAHVQPTPTIRPEVAHAAPPHDARPAEPQHPPAHQPASKPNDHPPAAHGDQHAAKEHEKEHEKKQDERRE